MTSVSCVRVFCILLFVKGITMITLSRVVKRMNQIELRLISETKYRTEDMSMLLSKLDDINTKLDTLTSSDEAIHKETETDIHTAIDKQTADSKGSITRQFARVLKVFEDEQRENRRTRRQVSALQTHMDEINKIPTLLTTKFQQTESSMKKTRAYIKEVHRDLAESITEIQDGFKRVHGDMVVSLNETRNDNKQECGDVTKATVDDDITQTHLRYARSCSEIQSIQNVSKVYDVYMYRSGKLIEVFCDQQTDGGGWIVFQRRLDGSENFNRSWSYYKEGFGNLRGEFWLGNEYVHLLTNENVSSCELRVDMTDLENNTAFAKYTSFNVGSKSEKYKLEVKGYSGTAGDSLRYHNGMKFQTYDNRPASKDCAERFHANWHNRCYNANPNGIYYKIATTVNGGIKWLSWTVFPLKHIDMKFRCHQ